MAAETKPYKPGQNDQDSIVCVNLGDGCFVNAIMLFDDKTERMVFWRPDGPDVVDVTDQVIEWKPGQCSDFQLCAESQEWTYGIDNTGTNFRWADATYEIDLSDGSTITFKQSAAANGGWTPQMQEWGQNIQAAADNAGLAWFVETRFLDPNNYQSLVGGGGFAGPPSEPVGQALGDGGMRWRYVNIQICPGQPVPVAARLVAVDDPNGAAVPALPRDLTNAGAVLGPIQKFWLCKDCGEAPVWYLEDGVTKAEAGQIPNCWEPCGTLALADAPPDRECEFFFTEACDNVNEPDDNTNWTNLVTRRATVCNGEQIGVEYFVPDPADPTGLIDYELVGEFVDCNTGVPIELPPIECDNPQVKKIWRINATGDNGVNGQRWLANAAPFGPTDSVFSGLKTHVNGAPDETIVASDWSLNDFADFSGTNPTSQEIYYAWIYLDKPTILRDTNANTGEWIAAYVGGCGQAPKKVAETGVTATGSVGLGEFVELPPGLYQVAFHVNDFSVAGGITLQESTDGGESWSLFPMERTWSTQPEIVCDCVTICDQNITELDGTLIEFDRNTMSWCEIECPEVTVPEDAIPDYEFQIVDGCDNVDGDPANFIPITRETVFINGVPTTTFYEDYGDETNQSVYTLQGEFVDCATGTPIDDPEPPPCESVSYAGVLWRVKDAAQLLTTVDWWGTASHPSGGNAAPHDNVSNIFTVSADGRTLEHVNGAPTATFTQSGTNVATSSGDFQAGVGASSNAETSGNDQIRVRGYVILNEPVLLRDTNPNTGERGGIWINRCCAGSLDLLFEDTTDSVSGDTGIFDGVRVPAGIHYFEAVTSDLSAWQGFQLSASTDDGATYSPLPIYDLKPEYDCIPLVRCDDTGVLLHADTSEVITVGVNDLRCEPPACVASASDSGPTAEEIAAAIVIAERDSIEGCVEKFQGNSVQQLSVPAGTRGNLVSISDTGTGLVYFSIDGSAPGNTPTGPNRGEVSGPYLATPLRNIDLSQVRFDGSSGASDYTVYYEKYTS